MRLIKKTILLSLLSVFGILLMFGAFQLSERITHFDNGFIRRFIRQSEPEFKKLDLKFNSYYFAGFSGDKIYLGNTTAPRNISIVDTALQSRAQIQITPDRTDFLFLAPQVSVIPPYFYLFDGTVPCIFKGAVSDWKCSFLDKKMDRSTAITAMDTLGFALRATSLRNHTNVLQTFAHETGSTDKTSFVLPAQVDGIFDTDGMLLYNADLKTIHDIYYYRNQYLTFDSGLTTLKKGKTIDTVSTAKIKVVNTSEGESRMSAPALLINKNVAVYRNLLFIQSDRIGRYEDPKMLKYATIIDVYDLPANKYLGSFYLYNIAKSKLKSFQIYDNKLFALSGNYLSIVKLKPKIIAAMQ